MKVLPPAVLLAFSLTAPAFAGVTVSYPANHTEVTSPFELTADATECSALPVVSMGYSLDNSWDTTIVKSTSVQAKVAASLGTHTLHVKSWNHKGASCVTDVSITVVAPTSSSSPILSFNAISVSGIQALNNWTEANDTGVGQGSSTGHMSIVSSPARSGAAREFSTVYTNYGGERYWVSFGDDTQATNFLYDAWVYLPSNLSGAANLELDMNQTMENGQTAIFGFQCDGWSSTWDYTANTGTPQNPKDTWLHSKQACNIHKWTPDTWHHVQISYSRDEVGNITYKTVWLDGVEQQINATVPSAFALGWGPSLLTNVQVDGIGASGSSSVYIDDLTISRW